MNREVQRRIFTRQLTAAGLDPASVPYLVELSLGTPGGKLPDLEALAKAPRLKGNRVIIVPIDLELVFTGTHWTPLL